MCCGVVWVVVMSVWCAELCGGVVLGYVEPVCGCVVCRVSVSGCGVFWCRCGGRMSSGVLN